MKNETVILLVLSAVFSTACGADVVKGHVGLSMYPSVEDVARAYEESDSANFEEVAMKLVESRNAAREKIDLANSAVVELQTLPGFTTLRKVTVDDNSRYETEIKDEEPGCRVFCRYEADGKAYTGSSHLEWCGRPIDAYDQSFQLRGEWTSVAGRCLHADGSPAVNAEVTVGLIRTPVEVEESGMNRTQTARTDTNGCWRVDCVEKPTFMMMITRICYTNVVNRSDSRVPPYGISVGAIPHFRHCDLSSLYGFSVGTNVPNVTASDRAAVEKILAIYKKRNGKEIPRRAPMTDFPVSTNNVIYIPDLVFAPGARAERTDLFNGKDLTGWKPVVDREVTGGYTAEETTWFVKDGSIFTTGTPFGYLRTERADYANFRLHVEFRWWRKTEKPNSGVFVRLAAERGTFIPTCVENQLGAGSVGDVLGLGGLRIGRLRPRDPFDPAKPLSGITVVKRKGPSVEKPFGEWNTLEVELRGSQLVNTVNGVEQNRIDGVSAPEGAIALQSEGGAVEFRNIWIEEFIPKAGERK